VGVPLATPVGVPLATTVGVVVPAVGVLVTVGVVVVVAVGVKVGTPTNTVVLEQSLTWLPSASCPAVHALLSH
jgi:hypothetical protein